MSDLLEKIAETPDALLALPAARVLRDLTVGCLSIHEDNHETDTVNALVAGGRRPSLRSLTFDVNLEEEMMSWAPAGDLSPLWDLCIRIWSRWRSSPARLRWARVCRCRS